MVDNLFIDRDPHWFTRRVKEAVQWNRDFWSVDARGQNTEQQENGTTAVTTSCWNNGTLKCTNHSPPLSYKLHRTTYFIVRWRQAQNSQNTTIYISSDNIIRHTIYFIIIRRTFPYLLVSNEKAVRMFMFTCNLVIRQQVGELLNKANHLRRQNTNRFVTILLFPIISIHCQDNRWWGWRK